MARFLKRQFGLVALVVELQTRGHAATVRLTLEATEDGQAHPLWYADLATEQIGLLPRIMGGQPDAQVASIALPDEVPRTIGDALRGQGYDGPLWLHLVKPYGVLGALPWERLLQDCGHVVLRLPDALAEAAVEAPNTLNVILCASRPRSEQHFNIPASLAAMAERIVRAVPNRDVQVHVFADLECMRELNHRLNAAGLMGSHVTVVDPEGSHDYDVQHADGGHARLAQAGSPWLQWMTQAMGGRSVDVVHFVCHGYMADRSGSLAFAESPVLNADPRWCKFVGGDELNRFLIRLGAWSVAFSAPLHNYSPLGLRALADEFAQVRPGPVLHHEMAEDPEFEQLVAAYRVMYSNERALPATMPAIALCYQPALLAGEPPVRAVPARMPTRSRGVSSVATSPAADIPAWLASAHRFVEQKEYEIQRTRKTDQPYTMRSRQDLEGVARGVDEIKQTLKRLARKGML